MLTFLYAVTGYFRTNRYWFGPGIEKKDPFAGVGRQGMAREVKGLVGQMM